MGLATDRAMRERRVSPADRLRLLCDPGSLQVIRSHVMSGALGEKARPGDGVVGAAGRVGGRAVFCFAQDSRFAGGSLGTAGADTIVRILRHARRARVPVIGLVESAGARMQEGVGALAGYGRIFREHVLLSGRVPQISVLTGVSAGGGTYSPALTDFVILAKNAAMFLTGPEVVRRTCGEEVTARELGGSAVHERKGVCHLVAPTHVDAIHQARELLSYLPQNSSEPPPPAPPEMPSSGDPGSAVPDSPREVYDVREVIRAIVDRSYLLELSPKWARNVVTAYARIDGRSIGVIANQPRYLGGVLDSDASRKAARFVRICDAFGVPLVVIVDTPGFLPGTRQERAGVIRHGSELLHAFAASTVARITVVVRKAFGGAYITMNSKELGADFTFAWPNAELGIMAASQAVSIIHARRIADASLRDGEWEALVADYEQRQLGAHAAARQGYVDEIIEPAETRARLTAALATFAPMDGRPVGRDEFPEARMGV
jgi:acetyl-CoA carboxylase carboxyltransferase component